MKDMKGITVKRKLFIVIALLIIEPILAILLFINFYPGHFEVVDTGISGHPSGWYRYFKLTWHGVNGTVVTLIKHHADDYLSTYEEVRVLKDGQYFHPEVFIGNYPEVPLNPRAYIEIHYGLKTIVLHGDGTISYSFPTFVP